MSPPSPSSAQCKKIWNSSQSDPLNLVMSVTCLFMVTQTAQSGGFDPYQGIIVSGLVFPKNCLSQGLQRLIRKISDEAQVFVSAKTFANNVKHGNRLDVATLMRGFYDPIGSGVVNHVVLLLVGGLKST